MVFYERVFASAADKKFTESYLGRTVLVRVKKNEQTRALMVEINFKSGKYLAAATALQEVRMTAQVRAISLLFVRRRVRTARPSACPPARPRFNTIHLSATKINKYTPPLHFPSVTT